MANEVQTTAKYNVINCSIRHNDKKYPVGSTIELTEAQAKRLKHCVEIPSIKKGDK